MSTPETLATRHPRTGLALATSGATVIHEEKLRSLTYVVTFLAQAVDYRTDSVLSFRLRQANDKVHRNVFLLLVWDRKGLQQAEGLVVRRLCPLAAMTVAQVLLHGGALGKPPVSPAEEVYCSTATRVFTGRLVIYLLHDLGVEGAGYPQLSLVKQCSVYDSVMFQLCPFPGLILLSQGLSVLVEGLVDFVRFEDPIV